MAEMKKALIAMSGGVDSSVAAYLVKQAGYDCLGLTMRLFDNAGAGLPKGHSCCSADDIEDAYAAAMHLGIPFHVADLTGEFRERVLAPFAAGYWRGETPNPCIACNRYLKFGLLLERAWLLGCEKVATGHYARIEYSGGRWRLFKASDPAKDQSYVLYNLNQETLEHVLFPLGDRTKEETRNLAASLGLSNAKKHDSQDICFAPDGDYAAAVERFSGESSLPGVFKDHSGNVLGRHRGIIHYTLGQRRGLGLSAGERLYVCAICPEENTVVVGPNEALFSRELLAGDFNWVSGIAPARAIPVKAKIRYRHPERPAIAEALPDGRVRVCFDEPQRAITPGQSVVLYDGGEVLGGGIILSTEN